MRLGANWIGNRIESGRSPCGFLVRRCAAHRCGRRAFIILRYFTDSLVAASEKGDRAKGIRPQAMSIHCRMFWTEAIRQGSCGLDSRGVPVFVGNLKTSQGVGSHGLGASRWITSTYQNQPLRIASYFQILWTKVAMRLAPRNGPRIELDPLNYLRSDYCGCTRRKSSPSR